MSDLDAGAHDHADGGACGTCPPRLPFTLPAAEAPRGVKRKRNADGMFECTEEGCGYQTPHSSTLTMHLRRHSGEKPYACTVTGCDKKVARSSQLTEHMLTHTKEKPFACTANGCCKSFTRSSQLTAHMRTHTKEKPFACAVDRCEKSFTQSGHLTVHMRTHTKEKPFACTVAGCEYRCAFSGSLTTHIRTHSGDKPYVCTFAGCEYRCAQSSALPAHMRSHSGDKPYVCKFASCDYRAAQSTHLKTHVYYYHTEEGNAARHRDEEIIKKVLIGNGFDFKREHNVDLKCALPGATFARGDFVLVFGDTVVFLEVDEDQHKSYGVSCDVRRMADIAASLRIEGNTMRIAFVRYNPHGFQVGGVTKPTKRKDRHARLVDVLSNLRRESTEAVTESDVRVFYLFYDVDEDGVPSIFEDDEYDAQAKLWLASAIVN
jgi:hypothetical protein